MLADPGDVDLGYAHVGREGHRLLELDLYPIHVVGEIRHGAVADGHHQADLFGVGAPVAGAADAVEQGRAAGAGVGVRGALGDIQRRGAVGVGGAGGAVRCGKPGGHERVLAGGAREAAARVRRPRYVAEGARRAIRRHAGPGQAEFA